MSFKLKLNIPVVVRIEGFMLLIEGFFMSLVVPVSYFHHGMNAFSIPFSAILTLMAGFIFVFSTRNYKDVKPTDHEGVVVVCISWLVMSLFGGLPFLLSNAVPNFTDAFFEALSGFTTTGATMLTNIDSVAKDILFWRSMTQWLGGLAIIVFTVAILPFLSMNGMQLFISEMNGITSDKLHPRIMHTAKRIWFIYLFFTLLETLLLYWGDMDWYDAVCHSMTSICSGGFSTRDANIGAFSNYSQVVVTIFMAISGCNFSLLLLSFSWKSFSIFKDEEFKTFVGYIIGASVFIALILIFVSKMSVGSAFRESFFNVVSCITTTGFFVSNYTLWPVFLWILLFQLMFIGACSGSTSGGIKLQRHLAFSKNIFVELRKLIHPNAIIPVKINGKSLTRQAIYKNMTFVFIFFLVFIVGIVILHTLGLDFNTAFGASIATLSNTGTGLGKVGPYCNYAFIPQIGKWVLMLFMLLGRVELFSLITLFSRTFWRK